MVPIKERIKEYFFLNPTKQTWVRQLERELGIPIPSAIRYANELKEEGFIQLKRVANANILSANRASRLFLHEKTLFNIKRIFSCGLIDFVAKEFDSPPIVLFGSYSKGEDIETSDIDLYIETHLEVDIPSRFEENLQRKLQIFRFKSLKLIKNKELANTIVNGITLNGYVEVFK
jgi:predicted nucleotidyltransferase